MAKIIGNTTATPNPQPDWNQTDATKADYIKNKPILATRDDTIVDGNLVQWDDGAKKLVDSGKNINDIPLVLNMVPEFGRAYADILNDYNTIQNLQNEVKKLKKQYAESTDENERKELEEEINKLEAEIKAKINSIYASNNVYSIWYGNFNKMPEEGDLFVSTGKSNDGYSFGFRAKVLTKNSSTVRFVFDDLVLYHDGNIDATYAKKSDIEDGSIVAKQATNADTATCDSNGNNIAENMPIFSYSDGKLVITTKDYIITFNSNGGFTVENKNE